MMHALENHIWQSTLYFFAMATLAFTLRNNRASVRHTLWLSASLKFLIPFSLLIGLGNQLDWRNTPSITQHRREAIERIGVPLTVLASPAGSRQRESPSQIPAILISLWLCGFAVNCAAWWRQWRRMRAFLRSASLLPLELPVPAFSVDAQLEPGVYGLFRQSLLLPAGLEQHLTSEQFEAIIAHELCHVRRRDNLAAGFHMLVEALFWFHPAVWIIRNRLMRERELACDEEVLQASIQPRHYAEGILMVCRYYLKSRIVCVSGVTGGDLKRRIEAIMVNRTPQRLDLSRKLLLFIAASMAVIAPVVAGILHLPTVVAQEFDKPLPQLIATNQLPEFEVASIRPSGPASNLKVDFAPGGKLFITNATLRFLIKIAYDIGDDQLVGGPAWLGSKRFDLAAIPDIPVGGDPANMAPDQILLFHRPTRLRLQRLLADRFQLELRKEPRVMPIFALVVAKGGPKNLLASDNDSLQLNANAGGGLLSASGMDMATLAKFLSEGQTGRPVVDMTGLTGKYNFRLEWSPDNGTALAGNNASPVPNDSGGGISVFTALQQQLGLKLEARTSPADRLVVMRAELPSPN